jgi:hypothetical protein
VSKFLLNLLVQIFQSLGIFKNQILFGREFFFNFWPNRLSGQPAHLVFLAPSSQAGRAGPPGHAPLPLAPSLTEPAASPPPLTQPCHGRRTAPSFFRTMELQQLPPNNSPLFNQS